jgi:hypothetical protein
LSKTEYDKKRTYQQQSKKTIKAHAVAINGSVTEDFLSVGVVCMHSLMCRQSIIRVRQLEHLQKGQVNIASFKQSTLQQNGFVKPIILCDCHKTITILPVCVLKPA